jgi:hypothetical protein
LQYTVGLIGFPTGEFINGEVWTAGKWDPEIFNSLVWFSKLSNDKLKRNLYWNKIYPEKDGCVYLELFNDTKARLDDPRLGLADCEQRKKFVCEVNSKRGSLDHIDRVVNIKLKYNILYFQTANCSTTNFNSTVEISIFNSLRMTCLPCSYSSKYDLSTFF